MKIYDKSKEDFSSLEIATQEQIISTGVASDELNLPQNENGGDGNEEAQNEENGDEESNDEAQELEEEIEGDEIEDIKEIEKLPRAQAQGEADDGGYGDLQYAANGMFAIVLSVERNLNISVKFDYPKGPYIPVLNNQQVETQDVCCVRDAPISLTYNGILIYKGNSERDLNIQNESFNSIEADGCCCEIPPAPTPNYYFTYTNCDDEAYVDFYFTNKYDESEQPLQQSYEHDENGSQEYGDYSHYRLEFLPGFEPECGCDIVSVTSNVLKADSIEDITDPYVSGIIGEGDRRSGFQSFEYGRLEYTTHFEDACGVCWSLVNFSGYETITDEYTNNYYLVPICATPVEFDTICYYDKYLPEQEFPGGATGELSEYINDGEYDYQSYYYPSEGGYDYYSIYIDVDITFIEFMGNSLLAFGFDQYVESYYQGDYSYGYNYTTLLVDVPDTMGYDSAYIDNFILCSEAYFEFFWGYIVKNAGDIFDDVREDNILSDENALKLAKLVLSTYAENVDSPAFPLSEGVLEDTANNVYGLQYTGGVITTSLFNAAPFNIEDVYLTNVLLAPAGEAGITKVDLEICYCNDSIITRFEEFQAATGCDSWSCPC